MTNNSRCQSVIPLPVWLLLFRRMLEDDDEFGAWPMLDATRVVFFTCNLFRRKLSTEWFKRLCRIDRRGWLDEFQTSYFAKAFSLTMSRLSFCPDCRHTSLLQQSSRRLASLLQSIAVEQFEWMRETDCIVAFDAHQHVSFLRDVANLEPESFDSDIVILVTRRPMNTLVKVVCTRTTRAGTYTRTSACVLTHESAYIRASLQERAGTFSVSVRIDLFQSALRVFDIGQIAQKQREDLICTAHGSNTSWPNHLLLKFDNTGTLAVLVHGRDLSTKVSFLPINGTTSAIAATVVTAATTIARTPAVTKMTTSDVALISRKRNSNENFSPRSRGKRRRRVHVKHSPKPIEK